MQLTASGRELVEQARRDTMAAFERRLGDVAAPDLDRIDAALATLDALEQGDGPARMRAAGQRLRDGLAAQAAAVGLGIRQSGPPQMPTLLFDDDADCAKGYRFCQEALKRGVYLHPRHNMFLSMAHSDADIDEALQATAQAFEVLASGR